MKRYLSICILLVTLGLTTFASNDTLHLGTSLTKDSAEVIPTMPKRPAIYDSIFSVNAGDSVILVEIIQDKRIEQLLTDKQNKTTSRISETVQGYRVQVFSSNTQRTAKQEALKIEQHMKESFPGFPTFVIYQSPFWKVRLGNFTTMADAQLLRAEIVGKYPEMQGDVYLVKEQIQVSQ